MKQFLALLLFTSIISIGQVQSPADFLGYEIGTEFTRHSDVLRYFKHISKNSSMVHFSNYGTTNERRSLGYAIVSSPKNLSNIETIQKNNLDNVETGTKTTAPNIAIVWLSYNVHGNEASSTEAAMTTIYELITHKKSWLENTVVIIDPCANPDGRDRYVNWYNQVKATPYNPLQAATEHHEPWPGGRPNHYLFDLNRDWVWATQVETQQRLKVYHKWLPHIHVDFHEQGINEPYYFAPAAAPIHEEITPWQVDFQTRIGKNHATYFDEKGWLFFTRERFDLLYPSYGDTYPTLMGAIGMTYEQAGHGRAGLGINNDEGALLTLSDRIAHHTTTGLSTIEMASQNATQLNTEFGKFFRRTTTSKYKSYILKGNADRIEKLTELLDTHKIMYGFSNSNNTISGYDYTTQKKGKINLQEALIVQSNQPKGKMVSVLLEPNTKINDSLTYDITAWSLPYAYGLTCIASTSTVQPNANAISSPSTNNLTDNAAGYISKWNSMKDATFLSELIQKGIRVRFSERNLQFNGKKFKKGSLIITKSDNQTYPNFATTLADIAQKHRRSLYASNTSFSDNRTDFGSPDIKLIQKNKIAVLKGAGISSLNYGAIWHYFETELKYPITSIDIDHFNLYDLNEFNTLILPSGFYETFTNEDQLNKLKHWINKGGKVIAIGNSITTFTGKEGFGIKNHHTQKDTTQSAVLIPYEKRERNRLKKLITGSIYKVTLDPSHPMAFGYKDTYFSLKLGANSFKFLENGGYNVGYIKDDPKNVSGFSGKDAKTGLKNSLVFGEKRMGRGSVIYMVDDVLFRSFWENGKLLFANSLFFTNN